MNDEDISLDDIILEAETGIITRKDGTAWIGTIEVDYTGGIQAPASVVVTIYEIVGIMVGLKERTYINNQGVEGVAQINSVPKNLLEKINTYIFRNTYQ